MSKPNPQHKKKDESRDARVRSSDRREKQEERSWKRRMDLAEKRTQEFELWLKRVDVGFALLNKEARGKKLTAPERALLASVMRELNRKSGSRF